MIWMAIVLAATASNTQLPWIGGGVHAASVQHTKDDHHRRNNKRSLDAILAHRPTSQASLVRPERKHTASHKMPHYSSRKNSLSLSLAEMWIHVIPHSTAKEPMAHDFYQRLVEEEEERDIAASSQAIQAKERLEEKTKQQFTATTHTRNEFIFWSGIGTSLIVLLLSTQFPSSQPALMQLIQQVSLTTRSVLSVLLVPWLWMAPPTTTVDYSTVYFLKDLILYLHMLWSSRANFGQYLVQEILPLTVKTFKLFALTELWGVFWKIAANKLASWFPEQEPAIFTSSSSSSLSSVASGKPTAKSKTSQSTATIALESATTRTTTSSSEWVVSIHSALVRITQRGVQKLLTKVLEKELTNVFGALWNVAASTLWQHAQTAIHWLAAGLSTTVSSL